MFITSEDQMYTVVHAPAVERRHGAYLGNDLPMRYQAIRDQIDQQRLLFGQATHDALRLAQPENAHLVEGTNNTHYLAAVAANVAMVVTTLYQSSISLQHTAHMAGYDTSSLAPVSREIAEMNEWVQRSYTAFTGTWRAAVTAPVAA